LTIAVFLADSKERDTMNREHFMVKKTSMRPRAAFCLLMIVCLFSACSKKVDDERITRNIETKSSADEVTRDSHIAVSSDHGKVTLTGKVTSPAAQQQLQSFVREEPGVTGVDDQTSVDSSELASTTNTAPTDTAAARPRLSQQALAPPPPPPPPKPIVVPAGTTLTIRTNQALGSKTSQTGTTFSGSIMTPVSLQGEVVIPAGSEVTGIIREAKKAGKIKGAAVLSLALHSVTVRGHTYNLEAEAITQTSTGKGKRSAGIIAGGTGLGAAIGGLAGGGKGAAIGALTGVAAGTIGAATTGKRDIDLPAEAALSFRLAQPLTLRPTT
jgi:hypothetical protein